MGMPAVKLSWDEEPSAPAWLQELFPTPWHVETNAGNNRSSIVAADGARFMSGMNTEKAVLVVMAVNALVSR